MPKYPGIVKEMKKSEAAPTMPRSPKLRLEERRAKQRNQGRDSDEKREIANGFKALVMPNFD